jgi:TrmH family RNA methyltransferase
VRQVITSAANPRVKAVARLQRRRHRDASGTFPIEGARVVGRALGAGWPLVEAYVAPDIVADDAASVSNALEAAGVPLIELSEPAYRRISYREHPDGLLAVGRIPSLDLTAVTLPPEPLVLVVEAIEKPGNLGAMLRTADAAGADAVIIAAATADPWNPNVVRASQGALFSITLAAGTASEVGRWLDEHGLAVIAADPLPAAAAPWDVDLTGPIAIVVGSEHDGLSAAWRRRTTVAIPMLGTVDSLNASVAAAVLLYEARRQRA